MRHDRSIDLTPGKGATEFDWTTLDALPEWYVLVAVCGRCGRQDELDRREIRRRAGKGALLSSLPGKLRCRPPCGNREGNRLFLRKLAR